MAVAFDLQGPTFRHEQYAEYKATRQRMPDDLRDQFPKVREVVAALRIPVYELAGYEADDVIGTIVVDAERRGLDTTIVTGDLDMLQLVTDHTRLMTTRSGVENTILYDPAKIDERFGLVAGQMIDYKALKGDPSDNIPGVPGVGEKTAAKLIRDYGSLAAMYERIDEVKPDKLRDKLVEHREAVLMGQDLSTIVRDLPVDFDLEAARLGDYDRETVIRLFREYEFRSLIERLPAMTGETAGETAEALRGVANDGSVPGGPRRRLREAVGLGFGPTDASSGRGRRPAAVARLRFGRASRGRSRDRPGRCRRRVAGADRHRRASRPGRGPAERARRGDRRPGAHRGPLGRSDRSARALAGRPVGGRGRPRPRRPATPSRDTHRPGPGGRDGRTVAVEGADDAAALRRLLDEAGTPVVGHEVKPLLVLGIGDAPEARPMPVAFDTQVAAYILNAALRSQSIADVVAEQLDLILPPVAELDAAARAGLEALSAIAVREPLQRRLEEEGLDRLYTELELPLISTLARMEAAGVALDLEALQALAVEFGGRDLAPRDRDLRRCRARVQPRQPEAARTGPVLRVGPAQGQADEDRLLDRRIRAGGPAPGPPDDRQAARVARLHEAPLDLRRSPADAARGGRSPAHDLPPGRRRDRAPVLVRPEPPEHPDPDAVGAAASGARSWPGPRT